jgi:hypothetical protein
MPCRKKKALALPYNFQVEQLAKTSVGNTETSADLIPELGR